LAFFLQTALPPAVSAQVGHAAKAAKPPRALGLLELAPNGKAHLIPIAILIDGKYYDASAYKAAPVPMALWSETVYEAFRTGVSQGLFTVTGALQNKQANAWMAEGTWQTADSIKAKAAKKKPPSEPRGLNEDEGPPVLRRADKPKSTEAPTAPATSSSAPAPAASPSASPAAAPPVAPTTSPSTSSPPTPAPQEQAQDDQPPEDKNRPVLKRGKPAPMPAEPPDKPVVASAKAVGQTSTTPSTAAPAPSVPSPTGQIQMIPAISASGVGPDPRSYAYDMKPDEEHQLRKKMLAMAADEVRARAAQLASGGSAPVHAVPPRSKAPAAKPVQPDFEDVQLHVFDLASINEPELVLTATARMPQRSHQKQSASPDLQYKDLEYMITLVAREDVNGDLHKSLANLTDTQHLDVLPRLELIDAVDVDGDGRGELLFRQVSDAGSAFVVYRVIGDRLYPLFQGTPGQ
jgi:hypothetical protein